MPVAEFHRLPGDTPQHETVLQPGELIEAIMVPASAGGAALHLPQGARPASFEFALVSAAVGLDVANGTVRDVRVARGRRRHQAVALAGGGAGAARPAADADALREAAAMAGQGAHPASQNGFKLILLRRTVLRALETVAVVMEGAMAVLGAPLDRVDGRLKVTGAARYAAEFPVPGLLHAALVQADRPRHRHRLRSRPGAGDARRDRGHDPGQCAAAGDRAGQPSDGEAPLLQNPRVYFNGQPVAVVVADTLDHALAAAVRVRMRYQAEAPAARMEAKLDQAYPPRHFRNGARSPDSLRGDPDAAFATGAAKVDATYTTPIEHHNPMEPHATIARWDGDNLTVWTATQGISGAQTRSPRCSGSTSRRCG